jgi:FkbM family methyltransferase
MSRKIEKTPQTLPEPRMGKSELIPRLDAVYNAARAISEFCDYLSDNTDVSVMFSGESFQVCLNGIGSRFNWNINDPRTAVACLAVSGEYEPLETFVLTTVSDRARYVVDVGANIGYYSTILPMKNKSIKKLYAFEPMPEANHQLTANIKLNCLEDRVECFEIGISNQKGMTTFYLPEIFGTSATSSELLHPEVPNKKLAVNTEKLDDLFSKKIIQGCDLLKIDVEGAEFFVIEGALKLIQTKKPIIFAELLRKWSKVHGYHPNQVIEILGQLGYTCWGVSSSMPKIESISEETLETNFIFLNEKKRKHKKIISILNLNK